MSKIKTCLWFDDQAEQAAEFYTSLFEDSRIIDVQRYGEAGPRPAGMVMTVEFELAGQRCVALNGGPEFTFDEAISLQVSCQSQEEIDRLWERLGEGGEHGPCGWLKDRFGLSWQIEPAVLTEMLADPDRARADRVMAAMLNMKKMEIQGLVDAYDG